MTLVFVPLLEPCESFVSLDKLYFETNLLARPPPDVEGLVTGVPLLYNAVISACVSASE